MTTLTTTKPKTIEGLPSWARESVTRADVAAIEARLASLAGDEPQADQLRDEHERIYNQVMNGLAKSGFFNK